mmetsp:Transcript_22200/g.33670  ORF Transcript_22200/g.33670 Transcript_22200/m.33670 type:complete len:326 (+) Transcript_22200:53-1030(+)
MLLPRIRKEAAVALFYSSSSSSSSLYHKISRRTMALTNSTTSHHYKAHSAADSYEEAYFYSPGAYMERLVTLTSHRLQLGSASSNNSSIRRLLDIGGGTGNFSQALVDHDNKNDNNLEAIVVDPFLVKDNNNNDDDKVKFVKEPAEAFLKPPRQQDWWRTADYHQILLKEIVHHLKSEDRIPIFQRMQQEVSSLQLRPDSSNSSSSAPPSILIMTRPQVDIDYPLWDAARQVWKDNQPSAEDLCDELDQAGFVDITTTVETYPCQILLSRWQSMVRQRFWSTFSNFTNDELSEACSLIAKEHAVDDDGNLNFEDRLVCISARTKA